MKLILLSGGSGRRLFPLSNDVRSKQFLRVLSTDGGSRVSMLERVWGQLRDAGLAANTWICANKIHLESVFHQVGNVQHIEEPAMRDTFPAVSYAATYLHDTGAATDDDVLVFMPVDPMVDESYFEALQYLARVVETTDADIGLLGVKPTRPAERFGYILIEQPPRMGDVALRVQRFEEKPTRDRAEELIAEGALWNCGVFAFRVKYLRAFLRDHGYPHTANELRDRFLELPKKSFDYEVVERTDRIIVLPYDGAWADIGTWEVLTTYMDEGVVGPGRVIDCHGTHVINELNVPVVVAGINDAVVISSPDGILVADKQATVDMKKFTEGMNQRPMYEERRWGTYRVLDHRVTESGIEVLVKDLRIFAGRSLSYQKHFRRTEVWTVVAGTGWFASESGLRPIGPGDVLQIAPGEWHGVKAATDLHVIEVQTGDTLVEDDIVRWFMSWEEVEAHLTGQAK